MSENFHVFENFTTGVRIIIPVKNLSVIIVSDQVVNGLQRQCCVSQKCREVLGVVNIEIKCLEKPALKTKECISMFLKKECKTFRWKDNKMCFTRSFNGITHHDCST